MDTVIIKIYGPRKFQITNTSLERILTTSEEIINNPSEVRLSNKKNRFLFIKYRDDEADVLVVESKNGTNAVVTIFTAEARYLSKMSVATPKDGVIVPSIGQPQISVKRGSLKNTDNIKNSYGYSYHKNLRPAQVSNYEHIVVFA